MPSVISRDSASRTGKTSADSSYLININQFSESRNGFFAVGLVIFKNQFVSIFCLSKTFFG